MRRFLDLRRSLVSRDDAKFFFFISKPNICRNLNVYFQEAWKSMGLDGTPTFTDIRTSIATHAKNTHTADDRHKVSQFMCHDTTTADRFYVINLDAKQAALEGPESSPAKVPPPKKAKRKGVPLKRKAAEEPPFKSESEEAEEAKEAIDSGEAREAEEDEDAPGDEPAATKSSTPQKRFRLRKAVVRLTPVKFRCPTQRRSRLRRGVGCFTQLMWPNGTFPK